MSCILYLVDNGEIKEERVKGQDVGFMLEQGYFGSYKDAEDSLKPSGLSDDEVKELAKEAGIKIGRKGVKTLMKELGLDDAD